MSIINVACYKFVTLTALEQLKQRIYDQARQCNLKGTVLLAEEGVNLMLAGDEVDMENFKTFLTSVPEFIDLHFKESFSKARPFKKLVVRIKKEIITMRCHDIDPQQQTAPHLSPERFRQWYQEKRDMVVLDTRNDFEFEMGTFAAAMGLDIQSFGEFPAALEQLPDEIKQKPVVTFCTGGIRCEKASALMLKKGFKEVYQLDGGILNFLEKCGQEYFNGECFVFDDRVTVDASSTSR